MERARSIAIDMVGEIGPAEAEELSKQLLREEVGEVPGRD